MVSSTSETARRFGGFGLARGLNPTGTDTGAVLTDAIYLTRSDPEALSRLVAARIAGGARLHPSLGRYVSPKHMAAVVSYDRTRAMPFVTVRNVGFHLRRAYSLSLDPRVRRNHMVSAVSFLRGCGVLAASSASELCAELTPDVLMVDISDCVTNLDKATDLLACARATGWLSMERCIWSEVHRVALSVGSNLRRVEGLTISTIYEHVDDEAASSMLLVMNNLPPQEVPSAAILSRMTDVTKDMLVQRDVWQMRTFDDVLALGIQDPYMILCAASGVLVPRTWLMERARHVIRPPVLAGHAMDGGDTDVPLDNGRVHALRWPLLGAWGSSGVPIDDAVDMFGDDTTGIVCTIPDCIDISGHTLNALFRTISDLSGPEPQLVAAGAAIFGRILEDGLKFSGADVRDAFKSTKVGRGLVRRDSVNVANAVREEDATTFGVSDVCGICKRIGPRCRAMATLAAAGAKFGIVDAVRTLGPHAIPFVNDGVAVATCPRDVVAACRAMTVNRASKSAKHVVSLIEALRGGLFEAHVRACGRTEVRAICSTVCANDRARVLDALMREA